MILSTPRAPRARYEKKLLTFGLFPLKSITHHKPSMLNLSVYLLKKGLKCERKKTNFFICHKREDSKLVNTDIYIYIYIYFIYIYIYPPELELGKIWIHLVPLSWTQTSKLKIVYLFTINTIKEMHFHFLSYAFHLCAVICQVKYFTLPSQLKY